MTAIGIVGAGAAAAAAVHVLDSAVPGVDVTVLEKSRGVCGRAATRRHGDVTYDYGANYLKADDDRVVDLVTGTLDDEGLVDVTDPVHVFDADGTVSPGRNADEHKWSYRAGLTQLAKRLFAGTDVTVLRETRVEAIRRAGDRERAADDGWRLVDDDGEQWGPFDAVLLTPPAPQTAELLREADRTDPVRERLAAAADDVDYRTIWTAVLHYPFELERPYYALVNPDKDHEIGWVAREECKRGHVPGGESLLVVQASHEWSVARYDDPPADNVRELAALTADLLDDERLTEPDWTDHQGWRYALPEGGVDESAVRTAEADGLYPAGDWVAGEARLHAALRNGLEVGERMAREL